MDQIKTTKRIARFAIVGFTVTIINYVLYAILANFILNSTNLLWLSSLISTTIAVLFAYLMHSKITWKERSPSKTGIYNFFIWNFILALIINPTLTQLFSLLTPLYKFAYNVCFTLHLPLTFEFVQSTGAFCLATAVIMILNFLFYDKFIFGKSKKEPTDDE